MVAAAGQGLGLQPAAALGLLAVVILSLAAYYVLEVRRSALERLGASYSPEVLSQKAQDLIRTLGFPDTVADQSYGFDWDQHLIDYIDTHDKPAPDWNKALAQRPMPLRFWYRQSPYPLTASTYHSDLLTPGIVDPTDPPADPFRHDRSRLGSAGAAPLPGTNSRTATKARSGFKHSGGLAIVVHRRGPGPVEIPVHRTIADVVGDIRYACGLDWHVARLQPAAARRGSGPPRETGSLLSHWALDRHGPNAQRFHRRRTRAICCLGRVALAILFGGGWLARRNMRQGRGDREGAQRLAVWIGGAELALWVCASHFNASIGTFGMFILAICTAVFYGYAVYAPVHCAGTTGPPPLAPHADLLDRYFDGPMARPDRRPRYSDRYRVGHWLPRIWPDSQFAGVWVRINPRTWARPMFSWVFAVHSLFASKACRTAFATLWAWLWSSFCYARF